MVLEKYDVQPPPWRFFDSTLTSDSTVLSINIFEESNINNCYIIVVYCLNAISLVCCFKINAYEAISMSINKNYV